MGGILGLICGNSDIPGIGSIRFHGRAKGRIKGAFEPQIEGVKPIHFSGDLDLVINVMDCSTPCEALEIIRNRSTRFRGGEESET
jgi:hypothetical protein